MPVSVVVSGKLRRYANLTWRDHVRHIFKTYLRNVWDMVKVGVGFLQSLIKFAFWRPDVVFAKGGFVCLPVGLAAKIWRIPLVIHDSDSHPGLTNRILAKYATAIGTGSPTKYYPSYPKSRTKFVGIPVRSDFRKLSIDEKKRAKKQFGFDSEKPLVLSMGGGLGAAAINDAMMNIAPLVCKNGVQILHVTGQKDFVRISGMIPQINGYKIEMFISDDVAKIMGAADVVVTRAGATTLAELAALGSAAILIPSPYLAGDHQTQNAKIYVEADAALMVDERSLGDGQTLFDAVMKVLGDDDLRKTLGENLYTFARPNALDDMATMITEAAHAA